MYELDDLFTQARNNYMAKMQELERMQTPLTPSTPATPFVAPRMTTSISTGTCNNYIMTPTSPSFTANRRASDDSENIDDIPKIPNSLASIVNKHFPATAVTDPMTPITPHKRIERFMKQISSLGNHPDPAKQTSKVAKLKIEAADAGEKREREREYKLPFF